MSVAAQSAWRFQSTGHLVERGTIRRLAEALEDPNPLWRDAAAARELGYPAELAPPTLVDAYNPFYAGEPYPVAPDLPHRFSAGDELVLHRPICAGDVLSVTCDITDDHERLRSDGTSRMRFTTYRKRYADKRGDVVAEERWTAVYFDGARTGSGRSTAPRPAWATVPLGSEVRTVTPLSIVRWTAAVGDFERTHFDYRHAVDECGLPNVVGHGPYTAAMLLKVVTDHLRDPGALRRAAFRYRAPVYPGDRITFAGWTAGDARAGERKAYLEAVKQDGSLVTTGECTWNPDPQEIA